MAGGFRFGRDSSLSGHFLPRETVAHAKSVVRDIRVEHGVDEGFLRKVADDPMILKAWVSREKQLRSALKELSEGLYTKDTHFMLELLQNADDNEYPADEEPSLSIRLQPRTISVECNETGFREENVRAISKIGETTKRLGESKGYIGEKGIGFKSVFKAANVVHVHSSPYSFKFDVTAGFGQDQLGMLAPIWEEAPPLNPFRYQTHILLELLPTWDLELLQTELEAIDGSILLFLHKIKTLSITFPNGAYKRFVKEDGNGIPNAKILMLESSSATAILGAMTTKYTYFIHRFTSSNRLLSDSRRAGIASSEIVLAFPLVDGCPALSSQLVYAFLPLKDFGFKFLIQADFLVSSNREDIQSCLWNMALRNDIVDAFLESIKYFLGDEKLKYTWVRFIPTTTLPKSFLCGLAGSQGSLLSTLKCHSSLYSRSGKLRAPTALKIIPERFRDRHDDPLLGGSSDFENQLSPHYAIRDLPILKSLGVKKMTTNDFVTELAGMLEGEIKCKSPKWHEDLAQTLLGPDFQPFCNSVKRALLIPLRDGGWVRPSSTDKQLYFDLGERDLSIPADLELSIVDPKASSRTLRKRLFRWLGVKTCNHRDICKLILEKHRNQRQPYQLDSLITHAVYVFANRNKSSSIDPSLLWLVDTKLNERRGTSLYFDRPNSSFKVSSVLDTASSDVHFLHPDYLGAVLESSRDTWYNWLVSALDVSDIPRLCIQNFFSSRLTPEFQSIISRHPSKVFLKLLVDNWRRYSSSVEKVQSVISSTQVTCADGKRPLRETVLPLPEIVQVENLLAPHKLPLLEVDSRDNLVSYEVLELFGVTISDSLDLNLLILRNLSNKVKPELSLVVGIYKRMEAFLTLEPYHLSTVRRVFLEEPLIYIPEVPFRDTAPKNHWVKSERCLWSAPPCVKFKHYTLQSRYGVCNQLFRDHLQIRDAIGSDLVDEIIYARQLSPPKPTKSILQALVKYPTNFLSDDTRLDEVDCLPMRDSDGVLSYVSCLDKFFIPDQQSLVDTFKGSVPLLDFSVDEVRRLKPLFEQLQITGQSLRACVTISCDPVGTPIEDAEWTERLRSKSDYLSRCAKNFNAKTPGPFESVPSLLSTLRVCRVRHVRASQSISSQGFRISKDTKSEMYLQTASRSLILYLSENRTDLTAVLCHYLPEKLMELLCISDNKAANIISSILLLSGTEIERILDNADIEGLSESDTQGGPMADDTGQATKGSTLDQLSSSRTKLRSLFNQLAPALTDANLGSPSLGAATPSDASRLPPMLVNNSLNTTELSSRRHISTSSTESDPLRLPESPSSQASFGSPEASNISSHFPVRPAITAPFPLKSTVGRPNPLFGRSPGGPSEPAAAPATGFFGRSLGCPSELAAAPATGFFGRSPGGPSESAAAPATGLFGSGFFSSQARGAPTQGQTDGLGNFGSVHFGRSSGESNTRTSTEATPRSPQRPSTRPSSGAPISHLSPEALGGDEESVTNPWAKPSSAEIQNTFPDFQTRMQNLADSARVLEQPSIVTTERRSNAFGNMNNLGDSLPEVSGTGSRRRSSHPRVASNPEPLDHPHPRNAGSRNRTTKQRRTDFGIGFLGEFFVVNYLISILPSFNAEKNWTSTLRSYARVFDAFKDLPDYRHREISDITYDDGSLMAPMTRWLVARGYAQAERWLARPPRYHIEVKTTTGECGERFFMSCNQAKLARSMAIPTRHRNADTDSDADDDDAGAGTNASDPIPEKVYIIFRVFNVETTPQLCVYMDPWALFVQKELFLCPEGFAVAIGRGEAWVLDCEGLD